MRSSTVTKVGARDRVCSLWSSTDGLFGTGGGGCVAWGTGEVDGDGGGDLECGRLGIDGDFSVGPKSSTSEVFQGESIGPPAA